MKTNYTEQQIKDLNVVLGVAAETIDGFHQSIIEEFGNMRKGELQIDGVDANKKEDFESFSDGIDELAQLIRILKIQQRVLNGDEIEPDVIRIYDEYHQTIDNL
tara:strand:- start:48 stop:359 length:312 start_codon:yes stop_codon:yes gene_type:complete